MIAVGIESDKDGISVAHVFIEVYHTFLFAHIVGMAELINFHNDNVRTKVNKDVGTITSTTAIYRLITT